MYVSFSSHCDWGPYHGWQLGYDADTRQQRVVNNDTQDGASGSMWERGARRARRAQGHLADGAGNGRGGVEGGLGWFRGNWLVPVPEAKDLASLNEQLLVACTLGRDRTIIGRSLTVGQAARIEKPYLLPLAEERFPIDEILYPLVVDGKGCVKVKTNWYSTPLWPGRRVTARVWPSLVEVQHDGRGVARPQRSYGRGNQIRNQAHYPSGR